MGYLHLASNNPYKTDYQQCSSDGCVNPLGLKCRGCGKYFCENHARDYSIASGPPSSMCSGCVRAYYMRLDSIGSLGPERG
jgi:hypothetical protein